MEPKNYEYAVWAGASFVGRVYRDRAEADAEAAKQEPHHQWGAQVYRRPVTDDVSAPSERAGWEKVSADAWDQA